MLLEHFNGLLEHINGCTFASLDAETRVGGLIKRVRNERIILFTNKYSSGYENLVRRRLEQASKDPDTFVLGERRWGERIPNTPLITHQGFFYLQTIFLAKGEEKFFFTTGAEVPTHLISAFIKGYRPNQGLPEGKEVIVHTYALENIQAIRLLGESLVDPQAPRRRILSIR